MKIHDLCWVRTDTCSIQQIEALKKQKARKAGSKKEETSETVAESSKTEDAPTTELETVEIPNEEPAPTEAETTQPEEEKGQDAPPPLERTPSLSLQSKMRSSSFRQSGGSGPTQSPSVSTAPGFGPDSDTASSIYLKQATRIEELEKENKRLAKEASDGEKRYKKAEEELEVIREAEAETATPARKGSGADEVEKLVSFLIHVCNSVIDECYFNHQTVMNNERNRRGSARTS